MKKVRCYKCNKLITLDDCYVPVGGKSFVSSKNGDVLWICKECNKNRCKKCEILLDNKTICRCGKKHGKYREGNKICLECEIKINKNICQTNKQVEE